MLCRYRSARSASCSIAASSSAIFDTGSSPPSRMTLVRHDAMQREDESSERINRNRAFRSCSRDDPCEFRHRRGFAKKETSLAIYPRRRALATGFWPNADVLLASALFWEIRYDEREQWTISERREQWLRDDSAKWTRSVLYRWYIVNGTANYYLLIIN